MSPEIDVDDESRDPAINHNNVKDSFREPSEQPAMSSTTKELAYSLVEMKISLLDLLMVETPNLEERNAEQ